MLILPEKSWLETALTPLITKKCDCEIPKPSMRGEFPPEIFCLNCLKSLGWVPAADWDKIHIRIESMQHYIIATHRLRQLQFVHPSWEVFMIENQEPVSIPDPSIIRVLPGHIVYESGEAAAIGSNCAHRWILEEGTKARCILCEGVRELTPDEIRVIENAESAGIVFLKWPERFEAMRKMRGGSSKRERRARRKRSKGTGESRGVTAAALVPEGYVPVKEAAEQLEIEPKKLRRQIRSGLYEGVKVGGRVYLKIDQSDG